MGNVILWLNQNPAVSISILVVLVLVFVLALANEAGMFRRESKDYERKRIYRSTSRGSTVKLSRPLGEDEGYGK